MLQRNIKQSLTALEVFDKLEERIYNKDLTICSMYTCGTINTLSKGYINIIVETSNDNIIELLLFSNDCELMIRSKDLPKNYNQLLSDQEYNNVKERFLKIAQFHQDNFENWIKDANDTNGIDAE